jgi:tetratricopeptide (TPR) repeat protein
MASSSRVDELTQKYEENPRRYFAALANEYRKLGDPQRSVAICRMHLPSQPGHMSGHIVFGQALLDLGETREAKLAFESALALDAENIVALRHLGDIERAAGNLTVARDRYSKLLELDPRNDEVTRLLAALPAEYASEPQAESRSGLKYWDAEEDADQGMAIPPWSSPRSTDPAHETAPIQWGQLPDVPEREGHRSSERMPPDVQTNPVFEEEEIPSEVQPSPLFTEVSAFSSLTSVDALPNASPTETMEAESPLPAASEPEDLVTGIEPGAVSAVAGDLGSQGAAEADVAQIFEDQGFEITETPDAGDQAFANLWPADDLAAIQTLGMAAADGPADTFLDVSAPFEERVRQDEALSAVQAEEPSDAPLDLGAIDIGFDEPTIASGATAETNPPEQPFVTETLADLYWKQGHTQQALEMYRQLREERPDEGWIADRISLIETELASSWTAPQPPEPVSFDDGLDSGPAPFWGEEENMTAPHAQSEKSRAEEYEAAPESVDRSRVPSARWSYYPPGSFKPSIRDFFAALGRRRPPTKSASTAELGKTAPADASSAENGPRDADALNSMFRESEPPPTEDSAAKALSSAFSPTSDDIEQFNTWLHGLKKT